MCCESFCLLSRKTSRDIYEVVTVANYPIFMSVASYLFTHTSQRTQKMAGVVVVMIAGVGLSVGGIAGILLGGLVGYALTRRSVAAVMNTAVVVSGTPCVTNGGFVTRHGVPELVEKTSLLPNSSTHVTFLDALAFTERTELGVCVPGPPQPFWICKGWAARERGTLSAHIFRTSKRMILVGAVVGGLAGGAIGMTVALKTTFSLLKSI